jgi:V/A-type H+-transporting ATPase subunit F
MFDKVAVVGEADIIFALRALGVKVFSPKSLEEAKKVMESLAKENFALCFLHESFLEPLREEREALREKFCPVVVGFSDYRVKLFGSQAHWSSLQAAWGRKCTTWLRLEN